jgi:PPM family protein phosphatase
LLQSSLGSPAPPELAYRIEGVEPRPPAIKVLVCAQTDVGRARETNEDAVSVTELETGQMIDALGADRTFELGQKGLLLAVSDGMGGHQAGEVASALVLESLQRELAQDAKKPLHKHLEDAVHRANRRVHNAARSAERHGMGATLTAVFIRGTEAFIAEVGDSRGYILRNGRLRQVTRDQSMVQMLVDQGVMTATEARKAPGKNVILQAVGLSPDVRVAIGKLELRRGDRLMLCSDGVTNQINDDELRQILTRSEPREACETIIALANDRGGEDNETVIVADVLGEDLNEPVEFETVTSTFEVLQAFEARPSKPRRRAGGGPSGSAPVVPVTMPAPDETPVRDPSPSMPGAPKSPALVVDEPLPTLPTEEIPAAVPDDELEIEVSGGTPEVVIGGDTERRGWISSLLGRLSRGDKPKK